MSIGIVAFAFGAPGTLRSNRRIAQVASLKSRELDAPIYTQRDVSFGPGFDVWFIKEEVGNPPPTFRIARGAVQWAKKEQITELWVSSAKPHLWRCLRDLKYAVREVQEQMEIHVCEDIERYQEGGWYCLGSEQGRTRSRKQWRQRERILEWMPMFIYKLVAS